MDVDAYMKATPPGIPRSVIAPFSEDVIRLRSEGYTLAQIREFLHANGVTITIQALSAWFKRHKNLSRGPKAPRNPTTSSADEAVTPTNYVPPGRLSRADLVKFLRPTEDPQ